MGTFVGNVQDDIVSWDVDDPDRKTISSKDYLEDQKLVRVNVLVVNLDISVYLSTVIHVGENNTVTCYN